MWVLAKDRDALSDRLIISTKRLVQEPTYFDLKVAGTRILQLFPGISDAMFFLRISQFPSHNLELPHCRFYCRIYSRNVDLWPFHDEVQLEIWSEPPATQSGRQQSAGASARGLTFSYTTVCARRSPSILPSAYPPIHPSAPKVATKNRTEHKNNSGNFFPLKIPQVTAKCTYLTLRLVLLNESVFQCFMFGEIEPKRTAFAVLFYVHFI